MFTQRFSPRQTRRPEKIRRLPGRIFLSSVWAIACLAAADLTAAPSAVAAEALREQRYLVEAVSNAVRAFAFVGGGSGVVISPDGLLLSNHHVTESSKRCQVRIGGRFYSATVIGNDPRGDISLLQIHQATNLPWVAFADTDHLTVGQPVLAVGNAFATAEMFGDPTVTVGIISALHVFVGGYSDAIQTDAPVNPGNSGGPLLTMDGKLAGINGQIETRFNQRANTGIGLAIPANQIARFLPALRAANGGNVNHGFIRGLTGNLKEEDQHQNGAEIKAVRPGSTAEKAGLKAGDRIVMLNQYRLLNYSRFLGFLGTYPAKAEVSLVYQRGAETKTARVTLDTFAPGSLGVKFQAARSLAQPAVVERVYPGLAGERAGLKAGDTIIKYDGKPVASLMELTFHIAEADHQVDDVVKVVVERKNGREVEEKEFTVTLSSAFDLPKERPRQPNPNQKKKR